MPEVKEWPLHEYVPHERFKNDDLFGPYVEYIKGQHLYRILIPQLMFCSHFV